MLTPAQKEKKITEIDAAARKLFLSSLWGDGSVKILSQIHFIRQ